MLNNICILNGLYSIPHQLYNLYVMQYRVEYNLYVLVVAVRIFYMKLWIRTRITVFSLFHKYLFEYRLLATKLIVKQIKLHT